jgi:hypothetical protein
VTYLRLLAADTIEKAVVAALERKSALARSQLGDQDQGKEVAGPTQEEFCALLMGNRLPDDMCSEEPVKTEGLARWTV